MFNNYFASVGTNLANTIRRSQYQDKRNTFLLHLVTFSSFDEDFVDMVRVFEGHRQMIAWCGRVNIEMLRFSAAVLVDGLCR